MPGGIGSKLHADAWLRQHWPVLAVVLLTLLVYARSTTLGLAGDDSFLTVENRNLESLRGLWAIWTQDTWKASGLGEGARYYRPLAMTTFWLGAQVSNTAAFLHFTNVLIHALNAGLLAAVLRRRANTSSGVSLILASLWAVAAANTEGVLWISGRFDALAATFLLAAFLANRSTRRWLTPLFVACALLTKEIAIAWLPILILDDLLVLRRRWRDRWPDWLVFAMLAVGTLVARSLVSVQQDQIYRQALGWAVPAFGALSWRSFAQFLAPFDLDPFRVYAPIPLALLVAVYAGFALAIGLGLHRSWKAKSPASFVVIGTLWFGLIVAPTVVIPPDQHVMGDRYGYAATIGLVLCLTPLESLLRASSLRRVAWAGVVAIAFAQLVITQLRIPDWRDQKSLVDASIAAHPDNYYAESVAAILAIEEGDLDAAEGHVDRSLAVRPSWRALNAACVIELRRDRLANAEKRCLESAAIHPGNPRVWANLASVYARGSRWEPSLESALRALECKPGYAEAHYLAAVASANLRNFPQAEEHLRAGLASEPDHPGLLRFRADLAAWKSKHPRP